MAKPSTKDWRNLPIEKWNTTTVHTYLIEETQRRFGAEYTPGGKGSKNQRWVTEKSMIKREIKNRGPAVVRRFIETCWREYYTPNPKLYPFPTFGFMLGYMDKYWNVAAQEVEKDERSEKQREQTNIDEVNEDWF